MVQQQQQQSSVSCGAGEACADGSGGWAAAGGAARTCVVVCGCSQRTLHGQAQHVRAASGQRAPMLALDPGVRPWADPGVLSVGYTEAAAHFTRDCRQGLRLCGVLKRLDRRTVRHGSLRARATCPAGLRLHSDACLGACVAWVWHVQNQWTPWWVCVCRTRLWFASWLAPSALGSAVTTAMAHADVERRLRTPTRGTAAHTMVGALYGRRGAGYDSGTDAGHHHVLNFVPLGGNLACADAGPLEFEVYSGNAVHAFRAPSTSHKLM